MKMNCIQVKVSQQALEKIIQLFNASLEDILIELLQNARRASASEIRLTKTTSGILVVEDNGRGISYPKILLTLGESDCVSHQLLGVLLILAIEFQIP